MNRAQKLAAGLTLVGDAIKYMSFYNGSGGSAAFELSRPLTDDERLLLGELGFAVGASELSFGEGDT